METSFGKRIDRNTTLTATPPRSSTPDPSHQPSVEVGVVTRTRLASGELGLTWKALVVEEVELSKRLGVFQRKLTNARCNLSRWTETLKQREAERQEMINSAADKGELKKDPAYIAKLKSMAVVVDAYEDAEQRAEKIEAKLGEAQSRLNEIALEKQALSRGDALSSPNQVWTIEDYHKELLVQLAQHDEEEHRMFQELKALGEEKESAQASWKRMFPLMEAVANSQKLASSPSVREKFNEIFESYRVAKDHHAEMERELNTKISSLTQKLESLSLRKSPQEYRKKD